MRKEEIRIPSYLDLLNTPASETGEPLVNLGEAAPLIVCAYKNDDMFPYVGNEIWVRSTVAEMLINASNHLSKKNPSLQLKVVYGYRHPEIQTKWFNAQKQEVALKNASAATFEIEEITNTMVANPITAGHPTGGAVDVTIIDATGKELDMGTELFDFSDTEKIQKCSTKITVQQMDNRILLHECMCAAKFAPYYGEWWHFSYGDKEWAWFYSQPNAIYEQIDFNTTK